MAFLNNEGTEYLIKKLSDSNNIKISGNKYGDRVSTVMGKLVEKADNITRSVEQEITNDCHSFRVGTGNVDVSSDVEDGFGEIGLKGKTYQNVFGKIKVNNNAREVITISQDRITWNKPSVTGDHQSIGFHESLTEINKVYTLIFFIYENTLIKENAETDNVGKVNIVSYNSGYHFIKISDKGLVKVKLDQPTVSLNPNPYLEVFKDAVGKLEISYPVLLEGDYTNDDNVPIEYFEGIVGVGEKSKNLFNPKSVKFGINLNTNTGEEMNSHVYVSSDFIPVLQQTYYTVKGLPVIHYYNESKEQIAIKNTRVEGVIKTPQNCKWVRLRNYDQILITEQKLLIKKSSFILGTYDTFEPYYDNYAIDVLSCGRNLWNPKINLSFSYGMHSICKYENNILTVSGNGDGSAECYSNARFITVETKEDTDYYFHCKTDGIYGGSNATDTVECFTFGMDTQKYISFKGNPDGFTFNSGKNKSIGFRFDCNKSDLSHIFYDFNLTETKTKIDYEPYKEDKIQILLDEPLMRLPNGVCDEITRDGKLIRRVGKIVLDDTIDYQISGWTNQNKTLALNTTNPITNMKVASVLISNYLFDSGLNNKDIEGIVASGTSRLVFRILKTKLTTDSINGAKIYLKDNPITTYYELETPIITKLPAPYLRIFKDGHLTFNTLVAPESTHKVQLNKSAQIESCIEQVSLIGRRVENMEALYDDLLLQTSRDVDLLSFDYNLETGDE